MVYFLLLVAVLAPVFDRTKNKDIGLLISFFVLFFIAAFEYMCINDWEVYVQRWRAANGTMRDTLDTEYLYALLMRICRPIGFFGFMAVTALFNFGVYYYLVRKYIQPKLYWLFFVVFALIPKHYLLLVDTNRQTLTVTLIMLAVDCFVSDRHVLDRLGGDLKYVVRYAVALLCFYLAINIHTAAFAALPILVLPFIAHLKKRVLNPYVILGILMALFVSRFFLSVDVLRDYISTFLAESDSRFRHYTYQLEEKDSFTFYLQSLYVVFFIGITLTYKKLSRYEFVVALCFAIGVFIEPFLTMDVGRLLMYYSLYMPFLASYLVGKSPFLWYRHLLIVMVVLYSLVNFQRYHMQREYHKYFDNFQTVFEQEVWE